MNTEHEKFVKKAWKSSVFDKKRKGLFKVSDKELAEAMYYWDSSVRRFIRVER